VHGQKHFFYFFPMNLSSDDVPTIELINATNLSTRAIELLHVLPTPDVNQMLQSMLQLCRSLPVYTKWQLTQEVLKAIACDSRQPDMLALPLEHVSWFLAGVKGRAIVMVLAELWSALVLSTMLERPGCVLSTQTLVPNLVERFYVEWTEAPNDCAEALFSYETHKSRLAHDFAWCSILTSLEEKASGRTWIQAWDESVMRGRTAYTAQVKQVLLESTPLPDVLAHLVTEDLV
jgi:hypothetical protein